MKEKAPSEKFLDKHLKYRSDAEDEYNSFKQYERKNNQTVNEVYKEMVAEKEGNNESKQL